MEQSNDNFNIDIEIKRKKIRKRKKRWLRLRLFKIINVVSCAMVFLVIAVCMIFMKRPEISEIENRTLAKWPEFSFEDYFSGKYTAGIENHYNDTVPGRENFKDMVASIRGCFGVKSDEAKIHGTIIKKDNKKPENKVIPTETDESTDITQNTQESTDKPVTTEQPTEKKDNWDGPAVEG